MTPGIAQVVDTADLLDKVPITGGALVLMAIITVLTRLWLGSETRHRTELDRIGKAHVEEIKALKTEIRDLREEVREVRAELDDERKLRWRAQDVAAQRRRRGPAREGNEERDQSG